ncbi:MAG: hypothetical protein G3M78_13275 [Candidatus Nitrohelix vancouverensis]|uniref:Uncharacterized protein n=1 Tax=Candidatus Nitrohelix vancouverensis TaxID=2705534 RepID=A0A7T0C4B6_9BACT|nr:MAG: hypothetical protein G3M78_13275 [Candidatus Nitrohelix vancouverensis]
MSKKIIKNLQSLPNVITGLGLGIAEAQRNFNLNFLQDMEALLTMVSDMGAKSAGDGTKGFQAVLETMLPAMAPSRYQFTETTFTMKMDISQSFEAGVAGGVNIGVVQAATSLTYGSDYRAAAEVRTVIHAVPMDKTVLNTLLDRAEELGKLSLTMPENSTVNPELSAQANSILDTLAEGAKKVKEKDKKEEEEDAS